jgi:hypothetical protein
VREVADWSAVYGRFLHGGGIHAIKDVGHFADAP